VTLIDLLGLRRLAAALLVIALVLGGQSVTWAADDAVPSAPAEGAPPAGDAPPAEKAEAPRLQIQDEGPSADTDRLRLSRRHVTTPPEESAEQKPFWKSWVFWTVTGALVASAVGMLIYTSSDGNTAAPCPVDIAVSLGCYGAGRQ
jgi:hypothetical protein